ncbi:MAG: ribosome recycling factor [Spirochaetes bacterium DG_61]|jgi:ribosome recycling factor|nr:MAG: ribosome recycling factor [Spirochaetes bacterium DG_61]
MHEEIKKNLHQRMDKTIESLQEDFKKIRSGRANASLVEGLMVEYYGNRMPLKQLASISVPEPRLIVIQPWDKGALSEIEKAFHKSDLALNPNNDGKVIRISIPPLTEERRKELVKIAKGKAEDARIAIRNIRRDGNEEVKTAEKNQHISEDETKKVIDQIQETTNDYIEKINNLLETKEAEIMEV